MFGKKGRKRRRGIVVSIVEVPNERGASIEEQKLITTKHDLKNKNNFVKTNWGRKIFVGGRG